MAPREFLEFELEIGLGTHHERPLGKDSEYPVSIVKAPVPTGDVDETMKFPFEAHELDHRLMALQNALLRSGGGRRIVQPAAFEKVEDLGHSLFKALMTGDILRYYQDSRELARRTKKGLRVRLRVDPPDLAALPWEVMRDPVQHEYLCLMPNVQVVRYQRAPSPPGALEVTPPLRILAMAVSPPSLATIDAADERRRITESTEQLSAGGILSVDWVEGTTWRALDRALSRGTYHVFHFIGHGGFNDRTQEGFVALCLDDGRIDEFDARRLSRILTAHDELRLVVLNACEGARASSRDPYSSVAAKLVHQGIPAVIAMQYEISDVAARIFAHDFYEQLAAGQPVDAAVGQARRAVQFDIKESLEWLTPVLHSRSPDGVLFRIAPSRSSRDVAADAARARERAEEAERARRAEETEKARRTEEAEKARREEREQERLAKEAAKERARAEERERARLAKESADARAAAAAAEARRQERLKEREAFKQREREAKERLAREESERARRAAEAAQVRQRAEEAEAARRAAEATNARQRAEEEEQARRAAEAAKQREEQEREEKKKAHEKPVPTSEHAGLRVTAAALWPVYTVLVAAGLFDATAPVFVWWVVTAVASLLALAALNQERYWLAGQALVIALSSVPSAWSLQARVDAHAFGYSYDNLGVVLVVLTAIVVQFLGARALLGAPGDFPSGARNMALLGTVTLLGSVVVPRHDHPGPFPFDSGGVTPPPPALVGLVVSPESLVLQRGDTMRLIVERHFADSSRTPAVATWSSSRVSVASVDENGTVTGRSAGTARVTAASAGYSAEVLVRVVVPQPAVGEMDVPARSLRLPASGEAMRFYVGNAFTTVIDSVAGLSVAVDLLLERPAGRAQSYTFRCAFTREGVAVGGDTVVVAFAAGRREGSGRRSFTQAGGWPVGEYAVECRLPDADAVRGAFWIRSPNSPLGGRLFQRGFYAGGAGGSGEARRVSTIDRSSAQGVSYQVRFRHPPNAASDSLSCSWPNVAANLLWLRPSPGVSTTVGQLVWPATTVQSWPVGLHRWTCRWRGTVILQDSIAVTDGAGPGGGAGGRDGLPASGVTWSMQFLPGTVDGPYVAVASRTRFRSDSTRVVWVAVVATYPPAARAGVDTVLCDVSSPGGSRETETLLLSVAAQSTRSSDSFGRAGRIGIPGRLPEGIYSVECTWRGAIVSRRSFSVY